jgi:hypothetical protein
VLEDMSDVDNKCAAAANQTQPNTNRCWQTPTKSKMFLCGSGIDSANGSCGIG